MVDETPTDLGADEGRSPQRDSAALAQLGVGWSEEQVRTFIDGTYDRDAILEALCGYADWWLDGRILLVLYTKTIQPFILRGWPGAPDRAPEDLRQRRIEVDPDALIFDPDQVGHFLADRPADIGLLDVFIELDLDIPEKLLNQSIRLGDRPHMLLLGKPRPGFPRTPPGIERLERVAVAAGKQLEVILFAAEHGELPPVDERWARVPEPEGTHESEVGELTSLAELSSRVLDSPNASASPVGEDAASFLDEAFDEVLSAEAPTASEPEDAASYLDEAFDEEQRPAASEPEDAASYLDEAFDKEQRAEAPAASGPGEEAVDERQDAPAPECQIVHFVSLAHGRGAALETAAAHVDRLGEPPEPADSDPAAPAEDLMDDEDLLELVDMLDSRNPAKAFSAARHVTDQGTRVVEELGQRLPGRLFVDRHEHEIDDLPPLREHGPILAALADFGDKAVSFVEDYLEHDDVELRFYGTLLFEALPVDSVADKLIERLFDDDPMIRDLAAKLLAERTDEIFRTHDLLPRLREWVEANRNPRRVASSARLIGLLRDQYAVPTLIGALADCDDETAETILWALRRITYQPLDAQTQAWLSWWESAQDETRHDWLAAALEAEQASVRELAQVELNELPGLDIDYHPDATADERAHAREQLRAWLDAQ